METDDLRVIVNKLYAFIEDGLYLNRPDMEIKGTRFNAALLMSLLTGLSQGRQLIIGEPGMGKTTSAEYICALLYRLPLGTVWRSEVSGHPEQTEEKIIGRPDLGALNRGKEVVVWSYFSLLPTKIVDEINRLPETKQSLILDGVDRGKWEYLNDMMINPEYCLFATANYQDPGTNTIIAPLMDRFDVTVESRHPGANLAYEIGLKNANGPVLRAPDLEEDFHRILSQKTSYSVQMESIETLCSRFGDSLFSQLGIETLSKEDRREIRAQKSKIPFDLDANAFVRVVLSELSFCYHFGQKRSHEVCEEGCHFSGYLCHATANCTSNRLPSSLRNYAQTIAWLLGDDTVDLEHLMAVLPFALCHRIQWKEEMLTHWDTRHRDDPLSLHMAKQAVRDMHRRYLEQGDRIKEALSVACRISEGEVLDPIRGEHPIYWEIMKDLGKEIREE